MDVAGTKKHAVIETRNYYDVTCCAENRHACKQVARQHPGDYAFPVQTGCMIALTWLCVSRGEKKSFLLAPSGLARIVGAHLPLVGM